MLSEYNAEDGNAICESYVNAFVPRNPSEGLFKKTEEAFEPLACPLLAPDLASAATPSDPPPTTDEATQLNVEELQLETDESKPNSNESMPDSNQIEFHESMPDNNNQIEFQLDSNEYRIDTNDDAVGAQESQFYAHEPIANEGKCLISHVFILTYLSIFSTLEINYLHRNNS